MVPLFGIVFSYLWEKNFFGVSVESLVVLQCTFTGCSFREFFTSFGFFLACGPGIFFLFPHYFVRNLFISAICSLILSVNASIALAILSRVISRRAMLLW